MPLPRVKRHSRRRGVGRRAPERARVLPSDGFSVDLNSDLGESFGAWQLGHDSEMMDFITSANVACGFHAGDPTVMRRTIRLAKAKGVVVGAHPGYPDLGGFGRRAMALSRDEIVDALVYQIGALEALARAEGVHVAYVKAHGALYNQAERDPAVAAAVIEAVCQAGDALSVVAASGSAMAGAAEAAGLRFVPEVFADRAYDHEGHLLPRDRPGSVITDPEAVAARVVGMVCRGEVRTDGGGSLALRAGTVCLHGDTPGAPVLARAVRVALEQAGVRVVAFA